MDDLISRWSAIDALTDTNLKRNVDNVCDGDMNRTRRAAQRIIAQLPAVDAVPVVHGSWKPRLAGPQTYPFWYDVCSVCGYTVAMVMNEWNYCPHCGTKMDGERRESK